MIIMLIINFEYSGLHCEFSMSLFWNIRHEQANALTSLHLHCTQTHTHTHVHGLHNWRRPTTTHIPWPCAPPNISSRRRTRIKKRRKSISALRGFCQRNLAWAANVMCAVQSRSMCLANVVELYLRMCICMCACAICDAGKLLCIV